jgi:hypothetical protein
MNRSYEFPFIQKILWYKLKLYSQFYLDCNHSWRHVEFSCIHFFAYIFLIVFWGICFKTSTYSFRFQIKHQRVHLIWKVIVYIIMATFSLLRHIISHLSKLLDHRFWPLNNYVSFVASITAHCIEWLKNKYL